MLVPAIHNLLILTLMHLQTCCLMINLVWHVMSTRRWIIKVNRLVVPCFDCRREELRVRRWHSEEIVRACFINVLCTCWHSKHLRRRCCDGLSLEVGHRLLHLVAGQTILLSFFKKVCLYLVKWLDCVGGKHNIEGDSMSCIHQALGKFDAILGLLSQDLFYDCHNVALVQCEA